MFHSIQHICVKAKNIRATLWTIIVSQESSNEVFQRKNDTYFRKKTTRTFRTRTRILCIECVLFYSSIAFYVEFFFAKARLLLIEKSPNKSIRVSRHLLSYSDFEFLSGRASLSAALACYVHERLFKMYDPRKCNFATSRCNLVGTKVGGIIRGLQVRTLLLS